MTMTDGLAEGCVHSVFETVGAKRFLGLLQQCIINLDCCTSSHGL